MVLPRAMVTLLAVVFGGVVMLAIKTIRDISENIGLDLKDIIFLLTKKNVVVAGSALVSNDFSCKLC